MISRSCCGNPFRNQKQHRQPQATRVHRNNLYNVQLVPHAVALLYGENFSYLGPYSAPQLLISKHALDRVMLR